jgi:hypothetical protein
VRGFLETCGVIQAWICNYSAVAQPLTRLLKLDQPWQWELEERDAVYLLKKLVSEAPCITEKAKVSPDPVCRNMSKLAPNAVTPTVNGAFTLANPFKFVALRV